MWVLFVNFKWLNEGFNGLKVNDYLGSMILVEVMLLDMLY